jgi:hypothetical protein
MTKHTTKNTSSWNIVIWEIISCVAAAVAFGAWIAEVLYPDASLSPVFDCLGALAEVVLDVDDIGPDLVLWVAAVAGRWCADQRHPGTVAYMRNKHTTINTLTMNSLIAFVCGAIFIAGHHLGLPLLVLFESTQKILFGFNQWGRKTKAQQLAKESGPRMKFGRNDGVLETRKHARVKVRCNYGIIIAGKHSQIEVGRNYGIIIAGKHARVTVRRNYGSIRT